MPNIASESGKAIFSFVGLNGFLDEDDNLLHAAWEHKDRYRAVERVSGAVIFRDKTISKIGGDIYSGERIFCFFMKTSLVGPSGAPAEKLT